tara:strand:+ start:141 stop:455 length:315 start_codon:yes stop_codon:yes gene_type:complete
MKIHTLTVNKNASNVYRTLTVAKNNGRTDVFYKVFNTWRHENTNYDSLLKEMKYNGEDYIQFMKESQWKFVNTIAASFGFSNKGSVIDEINNWFNYKIARASAN